MRRQPRRIDEAHCAFIRTLCCVACGDNTSTECAHIRFSDPRAAKVNPGQRRPSDWFTVPLCSRCHREQHSMNEMEFWKARSIDPVFVALALYLYSGDYDLASVVVAHARQRFLEAA